MEAICGAGNIGSRNGMPGCLACPGEVPTAEQRADAGSPTVWISYQQSGSFTRSGAAELVATLIGGCDGPHSGRTYLLERTAKGVRRVEEDPNFFPNACQVVESETGRGILLCDESSYAMGDRWSGLSVRDFAEPRTAEAPRLFDIESVEDWICNYGSDIDVGRIVIARIESYGWVNARNVSAELSYSTFTGLADDLRPRCPELLDRTRPLEHRATLRFSRSDGSWLPDESTKSVIRATRSGIE